MVFFGIQKFIQDVLLKSITSDNVYQADKLCKAHGVPFNFEGWMKIVTHCAGFIPVNIKCLHEGTVTNPGVPLVQVVNTDPRFPWVTSFIETALLRAIWYPTTVATVSRECKKIIAEYLEETGDITGLPFKLHDFGARGATTSEAAGIGGLAHLINFQGTDTVEALATAIDYGYAEDAIGFSIPASEHSTITSWRKDDDTNEVLAFKNMLDQFGGGLVACVSDSFDIYKACSDLWGTILKDKIENMGGTLVVRPDSGDPVEITLEVIDRLGEKFGYTVNEKGYKVLPDYIRMIQGNGVNLRSIRAILENFKQNGWSADNIAFGMGGALLQRLDRDTLKFAMKANEIQYDNGEVFPIFKDPITDKGKRSKKGRQAVYKGATGKLQAIDEAKLFNSNEVNQLKTAFKSDDTGLHFTRSEDIETIRKLAAI